MALRHSKVITFHAATLCDSVDSTNGPPGGMQQLANLIPDPSTQALWVPRPAAEQITAFPGLAAPGFISGRLVVGDIEYGMIASGLNPGHDQPYALNLATHAFLTVTGITLGNTPVSPPSVGDWTPPIIAQVAQRIIVTHPGFPGGATKFGWFDISALTLTTTGNTTSGPLITGNPTIFGVQPGLAISGTNIPANTTILSTANVVSTQSATSHSNTTLDGIDTTVLAAGQTISTNPTLGIADGTTIVSVDSPTQVTMSASAAHSATSTVTFTGATITMSASATGSANGEAITLTGGTALAPQWSAGDTNINPLPSVPVGVAQFNGRAYYALGVNGLVYSDSLLPCQVSNSLAVQALTTNDGLAVTALGPLMEVAALTGGIVQALIAFEGVSKMQQIQGDQTTSNLSMNALPVATGTNAPLSVQPCELGLTFVSPQGLRIVDFSGRVSPPIGDAGKGVTVPMIYAVHPSRICAAANADTIRISVQNGLNPDTGVLEFWFDITRKCWSGPHSFPASLIQPWRDTFVMSAVGINAKLWRSDTTPGNTSQYLENGKTLAWAWQTSLVPDNAEMAMNSIIEAMMSFALLAGDAVTISALDENDAPIDITTITVPGSPTLWGQFKWGQAPWGGSSVPYRQYALNWHVPVVFKQMSMQVTGTSGYPLKIGNLYVKYEVLGYKSAPAAA